MFTDFRRVLDSDVRYGDRKSQTGAEFDPHWQVGLHWDFRQALGAAPVPARARATFPGNNDDGAFILQTPYGRALRVPNNGSGMKGICSTDIAFWPNMVRGTKIICFTAGWASGSPPVNSLTPGNVHNNSGGDWIIQGGHMFSGSLSFGWYNNGTDTRVLGVSNSGLWVAGDLVTMGFSYSPKGTQAYVKGRMVGSTGTAPSTWDRSTLTATVFGVGFDPSFPSSGDTGWHSDLLSYTWLDRELDEREWDWIHRNPLSWPYEPGPLWGMVPEPIAPAAIIQSAVSMM